MGSEEKNIVSTPFCTRNVTFSGGVEINTLMNRFTLLCDFWGIGLLTGWPLQRGSTVFEVHGILPNRLKFHQ